LFIEALETFAKIFPRPKGLFCMTPEQFYHAVTNLLDHDLTAPCGDHPQIGSFILCFGGIFAPSNTGSNW